MKKNKLEKPKTIVFTPTKSAPNGLKGITQPPRGGGLIRVRKGSYTLTSNLHTN